MDPNQFEQIYIELQATNLSLSDMYLLNQALLVACCFVASMLFMAIVYHAIKSKEFI